MNDIVDDLKRYRRHQNASEEMVDEMNEIISIWTKAQNRAGRFDYRSAKSRIEKHTDQLKQALHEERKGRVEAIYSSYSYKIGKSLYRLRSIPLSYEVYLELTQHLPKETIKEFAHGDSFLFLEGRRWRGIYNDSAAEGFREYHLS